MQQLPTVQHNLSRYIDAGFPILYIYTYEEAKADKYIASAAGRKEILEWNGADGFVDFKTKAPLMQNYSLETTLAFVKTGKELNRKLLVIKDAAEELNPDGQYKSSKVSALEADSKGLAEKLCNILGVNYSESEAGQVDLAGIVCAAGGLTNILSAAMRREAGSVELTVEERTSIDLYVLEKYGAKKVGINVIAKRFEGDTAWDYSSGRIHMEFPQITEEMERDFQENIVEALSSDAVVKQRQQRRDLDKAIKEIHKISGS